MISKGSVVVGKKVDKGAVGRNRLRRQIYSILEDIAVTQNLQGAFIVVAKPTAATCLREDLRRDLEMLLARTSSSL